MPKKPISPTEPLEHKAEDAMEPLEDNIANAVDDTATGLESEQVIEATSVPSIEGALYFRYCDIVPELNRRGELGVAINEVLLIPQGTVEWTIQKSETDEEADKYIVYATPDGNEQYIKDKYNAYLSSRGLTTGIASN